LKIEYVTRSFLIGDKESAWPRLKLSHGGISARCGRSGRNSRLRFPRRRSLFLRHAMNDQVGCAAFLN
jgi:hypothetical protein